MRSQSLTLGLAVCCVVCMWQHGGVSVRCLAACKDAGWRSWYTWVQGHLQLSQGDPGGQASPGQRPEHDDDVRGNIGSISKTGSDINVLFDASHYTGNDGTRRSGTVTFITARENVGDDVYVGWYGTGICLKNPTQPEAAHATTCMAREFDLKNPTRVWHGNFIITKRRKHRPRERCLSAGARPSNLVDVFFKNRC